MYPKPYSIYLRVTITVALKKQTKRESAQEVGLDCGRLVRVKAESLQLQAMGLGGLGFKT